MYINYIKLVLGSIIFFFWYMVLQIQNGIRQVDEPLSSVNGKPQKSVNT